MFSQMSKFTQNIPQSFYNQNFNNIQNNNVNSIYNNNNNNIFNKESLEKNIINNFNNIPNEIVKDLLTNNNMNLKSKIENCNMNLKDVNSSLNNTFDKFKDNLHQTNSNIKKIKSAFEKFEILLSEMINKSKEQFTFLSNQSNYEKNVIYDGNKNIENIDNLLIEMKNELYKQIENSKRKNLMEKINNECLEIKNYINNEFNKINNILKNLGDDKEFYDEINVIYKERINNLIEKINEIKNELIFTNNDDFILIENNINNKNTQSKESIDSSIYIEEINKKKYNDEFNKDLAKNLGYNLINSDVHNLNNYYNKNFLNESFDSFNKFGIKHNKKKNNKNKENNENIIKNNNNLTNIENNNNKNKNLVENKNKSENYFHIVDMNNKKRIRTNFKFLF